MSSSGHLAVFRHFFGMEAGVSFDIFLHFSSIFVILIFFRRDIHGIAAALVSKGKHCYEYKLVLYIAASTAITGIFGFFLRPYMDFFATIQAVPFAFFFTSVMLFASKGRKSGVSRGINLTSALLIGIFQGLALFPGVSRSGATISAAKILGADSEEAFRFSFLMALPAIAAAIVFETKELKIISLPILLTGFFTSFVFGLFSLFFLRKVLQKGKFHLFGFYTLFLSILLFLFR